MTAENYPKIGSHLSHKDELVTTTFKKSVCTVCTFDRKRFDTLFSINSNLLILEQHQKKTSINVKCF